MFPQCFITRTRAIKWEVQIGLIPVFKWFLFLGVARLPVEQIWNPCVSQYYFFQFQIWKKTQEIKISLYSTKYNIWGYAGTSALVCLYPFCSFPRTCKRRKNHYTSSKHSSQKNLSRATSKIQTSPLPICGFSPRINIKKKDKFRPKNQKQIKTKNSEPEALFKKIAASSWLVSAKKKGP